MAINPLIFEVPTELDSLRTEILANDGYSAKFDVDGNLIVFLGTSEYKRATEGEPSKLVTGYDSSFVMHSTRRVGFEFTTTEGRDQVVRFLRALAIWSRTNAQTVTVRDYHFLEDDDAYALGYTVRQGILTVIDPQGGSVRRFESVTSERFTKGFRVTFWEKELREYY